MPHTGVSYLLPPRSVQTLHSQRGPRPPPGLPCPAPGSPSCLHSSRPPSHSTPPGPGGGPRPRALLSSSCVSSPAQVPCAVPARVQPRAPAQPVWRAGLCVPTPVCSTRLGKGSFVHPSTPWWPVHPLISRFPACPPCRALMMWGPRRRGSARGRAGPRSAGLVGGGPNPL